MPVLRLLAVLCLVILTGATPRAAGAEEPTVFAEGVAAYRRADFAQARALWTTVLDQELTDLERARVCYDLGNVEWRSGHPHQAIGWYTACLRLDPRHADAWFNLEFARSEAGLDPADHGDLRSTVHRLLTMWYPQERRLLALLGTGLFSLVLAYEALRGGRTARYALLGTLGLFVLLSLPWLHVLTQSESDPLLVIRSSTVSLRSEPHLDLPSTASVEPGTRVERIDELPGWVRVEAPDGERGWVQSEAVFALVR